MGQGFRQLKQSDQRHGPQVVFDAVGGPLFEPPLRCLAHRGSQLEITSAGERHVSFDLLDFYHNESRLFGVDTRKRDATASATVLEARTAFFEDGKTPPRASFHRGPPTACRPGPIGTLV
jgi:NADPH:quinone reductase-like Zn-dependent oxidoreductase